MQWGGLEENWKAWLERPFDIEDIRQADFNLGNLKSPSPDGFTNEFFKKSWNVLQVDLLGVFQNFFRNVVIDRSTNKTYIYLIPKKTKAMKVGEDIPINLVTSLYKIISKVLAERLKKVLPIIHDAQSSFIEGRQIIDVILLASKTMGGWEARKKSGFILKLDYEKAYDKVDGMYLDAVMEQKGIGPRWRNWIKSCLSSANFSIIINGKSRGKIVAKRGLRQRDPFSPFLFTIIGDSFSRMVHFATNEDWSEVLGLVDMR